MTDSKQLEKVAPQALEAPPDYIDKNDRSGFEDTTQSDMLIPRLALAQALSPQVTEGSPNRIEGLKAGDLFNSVTGQNYGREVHVQLLRKMPLRAMEFRSIDDGGGVLDPNVPLNDPRLKFPDRGGVPTANGKPAATLFRDILVVILPQREMIVLSFKSSGIVVAQTLWGLSMIRGGPCYGGRYRITTGIKQTPKPHWIYKAENAQWVSREDYVLGKQMSEAVKAISAASLDHGREPGDDDVDFPTGNAPAASEM